MYIYGWNTFGEDPYPVYHWEKGKYESDSYDWGLTRDAKKAKRFKSIEACRENFKRHHGEDYHHLLDDGTVIFYEARTLQSVII